MTFPIWKNKECSKPPTSNIAIEIGPVEIVDLPNYKMVDHHEQTQISSTAVARHRTFSPMGNGKLVPGRNQHQNLQEKRLMVDSMDRIGLPSGKLYRIAMENHDF